MSLDYEIRVGLPVFKALTALLEDGQTHDDVLREILNIDSIVEPEGGNSAALRGFEHVMAATQHHMEGGGFVSRGLWLPNGTKLRARYKGREYGAEIQNDTWLDSDGRPQTSPSAAANAITSTSVNGWRFWLAKRPGDNGWRRLDQLVPA